MVPVPAKYGLANRAEVPALPLVVLKSGLQFVWGLSTADSPAIAFNLFTLIVASYGV